MNKYAKIYFNEYYHIYNRTNNKELMFKCDENRQYFKRKYKQYLEGYLDIHAYALMSNHYHFSVKIKSKEEIESYIATLDPTMLKSGHQNYLKSNDKETAINDLIVEQHRRFFLTYTQAINKMYKRQGNLFNVKFHRSIFDPEKKFKYLLYYIHHNARKHGIVQNFKDYPYTSYFEILEGNNWLINIENILNYFSSLDEFISFHESFHYPEVFKDIAIED
jgi:REP element-mobilizing transposase RayT